MAFESIAGRYIAVSHSRSATRHRRIGAVADAMVFLANHAPELAQSEGSHFCGQAAAIVLGVEERKSGPRAKWWAPPMSSRRRRKLFDGSDASALHE